MALFAVYYYTSEKCFGSRIFTEDMVTQSRKEAQRRVKELEASNVETWYEQIQ